LGARKVSKAQGITHYTQIIPLTLYSARPNVPKEESQPAAASFATPARTMLVSISIFALKWAVAGLAFAAVLLWMRPDLRQTAPVLATHATSPGPEPSTAATNGTPPAAIPVTAGSSATLSYADAVARSAPAVINIFIARVVTERTRPERYGQRIEGSLGSGVIVDTHGHVVTNHHVIANAQKIRIQLADGRSADATVVGDDPETDLALLKIELLQLPVMPMGRSDRLRVGDVALAIGNPYGLSQTVTHGIVSATGRDELGITQFESFIQTDAAINVGNSGGALINAQGELIGINTAVLGANVNESARSEGIGFAIPVNMVRGVVDQILKYGHVRRGWLGVTSEAVSPQRAAALGLPNTQGAELTEVDADSPAARAGLQSGDVLTVLNGQGVRDVHEALNRVAALKPGSRLRIQGRGDRGAIDLSVTIAERPTH
jgi:serine protease DegS